MSNTDAWAGTVVKKPRGLSDGSNMYRKVTIETAPGETEKVRVSRELWNSIEEGDRLVKEAGADPRKA